MVASQARPGYIFDSTLNDWVPISGVLDTGQAYNFNINSTIGGNTIINNSMQISGFRNEIINGDFDIWQRGTTATATAGATTYFADRWACFATGATVFPYRSSGLTGTSSQYAGYVNGASGNTATTFLQRIESSNVKIANGSTFTVSAKISSPGSRNVTIYVQSANAADNFSAKTSVGSSTVALVSGVNTVKVTFSATAACANGVEVGFEFGALTSGTIALGQVQLEAGDISTPFEQRPIGIELALCQRYFQVFEARRLNAEGYASSAGYGYYGMIDWKVEMRTAPVVTLPTPSQTGNKTSDATTTSTDGMTYVFSSVAAGNAYVLYNPGLKGNASAEL